MSKDTRNLGPSGFGAPLRARPFNYKAAHNIQDFQTAHPPLLVPAAELRDRERLSNSICLINLTGETHRFGLFYERVPPGDNKNNPLNHKLLKKWVLDAGNVVCHHVSNPILVTVWVNDQATRFTSGKIWEFTDAFDTIDGVDIINKAPSRHEGKRYQVEVETDDPKNAQAIFLKNTVTNTVMSIQIQSTEDPINKAELKRKLASGETINFIQLEEFTLNHGEEAFFHHIERFLVVDIERFVGGKLTQEDSFAPDIVRGEYVVALKKSPYEMTFTVVNTTATALIPEQNAITASFT